MTKALVELKAKARSLTEVREGLLSSGAKPIGVFHQVDTYFKAPQGRLKLRETEGSKTSTLIYYERENVAEPKKSHVWLAEGLEPTSVKAILSKALGVRVVVDKVREIFVLKGVQVHLDQVAGLGAFIEFEKPTGTHPRQVQEDRELLRNLMERLAIRSEDLVRASYSDMIMGRRR